MRDIARSPARTSTDERVFSRDDLLDVLSNRRRRFAIHYLKRCEAAVTVPTLAEQVACWENETAPEALSHQQRKRVSNALRQFHLPKMDASGFVDYDAGRGTVELTDAAAAAQFCVDSRPPRRRSWDVYYLVLALVSAVTLGGLWIDVTPLTHLSPLAYGTAFVGVLLGSALVHFYDDGGRQVRLGAGETPPEVDVE
jgi:hypothetical protein